MEFNKLLLGQKQYIGKENTDNFIDVDLSRTIETIKNDSINNIFDFQQQFILERNASLKFCIYGSVESRYGNCDNVAIKITVADTDNINNSVPIYSPHIYTAITSATTLTTLSKPLSANQNALTKNLYGAAKGSYFILFELDKSVLDDKKNKSVYLKIFDPLNDLYGNFSIPIIYFNDEDEPIAFGTENADFTKTNEIFEINNNFPFFFDRHWVKLNLEPNGPAKAFFVSGSTTVSETNPSVDIEVTLDSPSEFGLERATVQINYATDIYGNQLTTAQFSQDFIFVEPIITWHQGEQIKSFNVTILDDLFVETDIETITFRIIPLSNCRVESSDQYEFTVNIISEDVPVIATFINANTTVVEPLPNSPNSIYNLIITVSSPVPVPGQSITLRADINNSTAIISQDYSLTQAISSTDNITVPFPQGASQISIPFYLIGNTKYDIDRKIKFKLEQSSSNIVPGNEIEITIQDSMVYRYVRYIIPVEPTKNIGLFKTIYNGTSLLHTSITKLEKLPSLTSVTYNHLELRVTDQFTCDLKIKNLGDRIIWNNQIINTSDFITFPLAVSAITDNIILDLPTNLTFNNTSHCYTYCKYEFKFDNFSKFYPAGLPSYSQPNVDQANQFTKTCQVDIISGSTSGSTKRYLVSEVTPAFSSYNATNDTCTTTASNLNPIIRYNGAILVPAFLYGAIQFTGTSTNLFFSNKRIKNECTTSGNTLPVGLTYLPAPPFNEKYAIVQFGQLYVQAGFIPAFRTQSVNMGSYDSGSQQNNWKYFKTWNGTDYNIKNAVEFRITNLGDRDVTVMNKEILVNETTIYKSTDLNFSNITLLFPTNSGYSANTNSFSFAHYHIQITNIPIYDDAGNYNNVTTSVDLGEFHVLGRATQMTPTYYMENEIRLVNVPVNAFNSPVCGLNPLLSTTRFALKNIKTNNILAIANTGSNLSTTRYNTNQTVPSCPNDPMHYRIF